MHKHIEVIENNTFNILTPGVVSRRCHKSPKKHLNSMFLTIQKKLFLVL